MGAFLRHGLDDAPEVGRASIESDKYIDVSVTVANAACIPTVPATWTRDYAIPVMIRFFYLPLSIRVSHVSICPACMTRSYYSLLLCSRKLDTL